MRLMLFCAGNVVDDDVTVNRIFLVNPVCSLRSAVCKCHTPGNVSVIDTSNKAHWAESNRQFIWAARNFARKTDTAVPLECGKQGTVSYDRRRSVERLNPTSFANGTQYFRYFRKFHQRGCTQNVFLIFENLTRNFYRSIQFRTGNLGICGRMESALSLFPLWSFRHHMIVTKPRHKGGLSLTKKTNN